MIEMIEAARKKQVRVVTPSTFNPIGGSVVSALQNVISIVRPVITSTASGEAKPTTAIRSSGGIVKSLATLVKVTKTVTQNVVVPSASGQRSTVKPVTTATTATVAVAPSGAVSLVSPSTETVSLPAEYKSAEVVGETKISPAIKWGLIALAGYVALQVLKPEGARVQRSPRRRRVTRKRR